MGKRQALRSAAYAAAAVLEVRAFYPPNGPGIAICTVRRSPALSRTRRGTVYWADLRMRVGRPD